MTAPRFYFEDFVPGSVARYGALPVERAEIVAFAAQYDPQPMHLDEAADLLHQFRFIPDARLDDLMISYATDGGGVGAHFDSYDVFLLQVHGQRRWRISAQTDLRLKAGLPL